VTEQAHVLDARDVSFAYRPGEPVLAGVSVTAAAGNLVCILGPNGSGKTTLLRCFLGRLQPQAGRIVLDGKGLARYSAKGLARLMAYVPQVAASAFEFTVRELVLMGRFAHTGPMGLASRQDLAVAFEAMKMTDTLRFGDRMLSELSGGEAQRVMIARALAQQPQLCLLDEPTSHLDIRNQLTIYRMMARLAHDWRMAVVCVSHDVNLAGRFADKLVMMRAGRVVAAGTPTEVVTRGVLSEVYGVDIETVEVAGSDVPIVRAV
jgi:iron complex transport system ATP-binding protein